MRADADADADADAEADAEAEDGEADADADEDILFRGRRTRLTAASVGPSVTTEWATNMRGPPITRLLDVSAVTTQSVDLNRRVKVESPTCEWLQRSSLAPRSPPP
jgi:hypothetical protein